MTPPIKLDAPYLPFEEYARRQHLDLVDAERLIESGKLPMKAATRCEKKHFVNMVTLSRIRLCKEFKHQPDLLEKLAMQISIQPDCAYLPTNELASRWNVSENSIRNMIRDGKLPVIERQGSKGKHYINMAAMWQHAVEDSVRPENQHFFAAF
ncbi:helix-turn-helix domain-containing protein [Vibrio sp. M260112]|uniref:helix-turn-helix domain-containing protein n=1 Tax=Vibrio sp. M260112 TaxID=3020895 RepID=UPI002F4190BF